MVGLCSEAFRVGYAWLTPEAAGEYSGPSITKACR